MMMIQATRRTLISNVLFVGRTALFASVVCVLALAGALHAQTKPSRTDVGGYYGYGSYGAYGSYGSRAESA